MKTAGNAADARIDYGKLEPVDPRKLRGLGVTKGARAAIEAAGGSIED